MGGAPPLAQRLPPAPPAGPPQRFPLPRSAAAAQRPPAGPTPHAWTSASRPRPPLFTLPAHHHARHALGPPASPPDAYLRHFAATRHTRDITSVIMEYWLRWAPARRAALGPALTTCLPRPPPLRNLRPRSIAPWGTAPARHRPLCPCARPYHGPQTVPAGTAVLTNQSPRGGARGARPQNGPPLTNSVGILTPCGACLRAGPSAIAARNDGSPGGGLALHRAPAAKLAAAAPPNPAAPLDGYCAPPAPPPPIGEAAVVVVVAAAAAAAASAAPADAAPVDSAADRLGRLPSGDRLRSAARPPAAVVLPLSKNRGVHLSFTPRPAAATYAPPVHGTTCAGNKLPNSDGPLILRRPARAGPTIGGHRPALGQTHWTWASWLHARGQGHHNPYSKPRPSLCCLAAQLSPARHEEECRPLHAMVSSSRHLLHALGTGVLVLGHAANLPLPTSRQSATALALSLRISESLTKPHLVTGPRPDQRRRDPVKQPRPGQDAAPFAKRPPGPCTSSFSHPPLRSTQGPILPRCAHRCAPPPPLLRQTPHGSMNVITLSRLIIHTI